MSHLRTKEQSESQLISFKTSEELRVVYDFAIDESMDSEHRTKQVRQIIAQMTLLAHKRVRPVKMEESYEEAA